MILDVNDTGVATSITFTVLVTGPSESLCGDCLGAFHSVIVLRDRPELSPLTAMLVEGGEVSKGSAAFSLPSVAGRSLACQLYEFGLNQARLPSTDDFDGIALEDFDAFVFVAPASEDQLPASRAAFETLRRLLDATEIPLAKRALVAVAHDSTWASVNLTESQFRSNLQLPAHARVMFTSIPARVRVWETFAEVLKLLMATLRLKLEQARQGAL